MGHMELGEGCAPHRDSSGALSALGDSPPWHSVLTLVRPAQGPPKADRLHLALDHFLPGGPGNWAQLLSAPSLPSMGAGDGPVSQWRYVQTCRRSFSRGEPVQPGPRQDACCCFCFPTAALGSPASPQVKVQ